MVIYSERLLPGVGLHLALLLLLPLGFGMLAPINITWAVVNAVSIYAAGLLWMTVGAPRLIVTETHFTAGRARIERSELGDAVVVPLAERQAAIADARAWKVIRAWIPAGVRVDIVDKDDQTPYWYVSSRRADELARVLNSN